MSVAQFVFSSIFGQIHVIECFITCYKTFDANFSCRGYQYAVGQTYTLDPEQTLKIYETGFHFSVVSSIVLSNAQVRARSMPK